MTKTLTAEQKKTMLSEKYIGVFPLSFDDNAGAVEIPDTIQLIPIGQWDHDLYGQILITNSDIREFKQNFDAGIRKGVPITAGHEGFEELPAVAWITSVECRDDGLWGNVEWNNGGKSLLSDKAFKFFSPEFYRDYEDPQSHVVSRNVLVGGALTKSPYFKELKAIVFSEPKLKNNFNETMDLTTLLAKDKAVLTAEEKVFIKEHSAELTEEQKVSHADVIAEPAKTETDEEKTARESAEKEASDKATADANVAAGLNADGTEIQASERVTLSKMAFDALTKKADEGAEAFRELKAQKVTASVKALVFSATNTAGKFLPKSEVALKAFMETLNADQTQKFSTLIAEIPKSQLFNEVGVGAIAEVGTTQAEVDAKVDAKIAASEKAGKPMKYSDALKAVMSENKGMDQRYTDELGKK